LALGWQAAGWVQPGALAKQEPQAKPADPAPHAQVKPGDAAPAVLKSADAQPTETKPPETKPVHAKPVDHPAATTPEGQQAQGGENKHPRGAAEHLLPRVDGQVTPPWWFGRVIAGAFWLFAAAAVVGVPIVRMMNAAAKPEPAHDDGHGGHDPHNAHSHAKH
jgi:hypothetical protein